MSVNGVRHRCTRLQWSPIMLKKKKTIIAALFGSIMSGDVSLLTHHSNWTFSERRCEKTGGNYLYSYTPDQASIQTKGLEPSPCVPIQPRHLINYSVAVKGEEKLADEKSASLQAQPAQTASCVLACKTLCQAPLPTRPYAPSLPLLRAHSCRRGKTSPSLCQSPAGGPRVLR